MRYFLRIQYVGTRFHGWQVQNDTFTVQGEIERALALYFKEAIPITGCGRTDAGVHATDYIAHLDLNTEPSADFLFVINKMLDKDVAIRDIYRVLSDAHARFDAMERSYTYQLSFSKNPFLFELVYGYPYTQRPDITLLNEAASIILKGHDFTAFAKLGTDVKTNLCTIMECHWEETYAGLTFHITANRFLRGMVRLIVGANINYALGKLSRKDMVAATQDLKPLPLIWSVPGEGLALSKIKYPYELDAYLFGFKPIQDTMDNPS